MEHRQGFSSEAMVLISCSLNVIMVMITQMTPGLWGIRGSHILTQRLHRRCYSTGPHMRPPDRARPGGLPLFFCPRRAWKRRVNDQINSSQEQKSWTAMREMDILCCLTLNAVFQSNYLSLLQPLLSQCMALKPEFRLGPLTRMWWIRCLVSIPFPLYLY